MNERHQPARDLFDAALELSSERRAAFLDDACAGDPALRQRVEALLSAHELAGTFMEQPAVGLHSETDIFKPQIGKMIGRYRLLQQIGEGGCGVVYMAEQELPVKRRVALKVIKLGMDTTSVIARFEAERQALALMDHPNIAKVLDADATDAGRPYFVMELVRGIKITDYCDQNNLSTKKRLGLFIKVCQAIQHAHQKGIIHRDIKPSNILVTSNDGEPVPKVIDFGIAKATQGKLTDQTLFTAFEQFIGTPAYMSPEQAEMSALDVDTRSDIYSLGVLLYELLTGQTPFESRKLLQAGLDEIRRTIREDEPARPSTRLSTMLKSELTHAARQRQIEPPKLIHLVRGDLDWIVMKALEKDRARRYETANGFAADIQRHLDNQPVLASSPGNLYLLKKSIQRHKLAFAFATVVALAIAFGLGVVAISTVRLHREDLQLRQAKDDATEQLRAAYLAEARAIRNGGQAGQRYASLESIQKASAIRPDLEARNSAIASLAVSDLRVAQMFVISGHPRNELANCDPNLELYAFPNTNDDIAVYAFSNNLVVKVLSAPGYSLQAISGFSANGKYLAAIYTRENEEDSHWVWNMTTGKAIVRPSHAENSTNQSDFILQGEFSPDSRFFAGILSDKNISIYDLASGSRIKSFPGESLLPHMFLNRQGSQLACFSRDDSRVQIRDVASGEISRTLTCPGGVSALAWSSDGRRLATADMDFNIYVWDIATGRRLSTLEGHVGFIMSVAFNHPGNLLASASYDGVVRLWNPNTGRQLASYFGSSWQIQFSSDDQSLLGWQYGATYGSLEIASGHECRLFSIPREDEPTALPQFSPDGRILAAGNNRNVCFWDAASGAKIGSFPLKACDEIRFPSDGHSLITVDRIAGVRQRTLQLIDGTNSSAYRLGKPRSLFDGFGVQSASLTLDGSHLAVAQPSTDQAFILDLQNPPAKLVLSGHSDVNRIALSPDGRWAATASWYNPLVKIWDAHSGDLIRSITGPARSWVNFSPDGRWLATSSTEYQLWQVGSWQPKGPPVPVSTEKFTAFSPDGAIMARLKGPKIQLLETSTERELATLEAPGSRTALKCQFSPDAGQLAVLENDQSVKLWDLRLIRQELAQMHLDWDLSSYPPARLFPQPATLEIEPDPTNTARSKP